jgi:hypothetical protein
MLAVRGEGDCTHLIGVACQENRLSAGNIPKS